MSKHSEAVRRWRQAHPEAARALSRENARKRRRRLGMKERSTKQPIVLYSERPKAIEKENKKRMWNEIYLNADRVRKAISMAAV